MQHHQVFVATMALLAACGSDQGAKADSGSSASGNACVGSKGTLTGKLTLGSDVGAKAGIVLLKQSPDETPLQAKANENGVYALQLEAGSWLVGAKDGDYCETTNDREVMLSACETTTADLQLECVFGGGGAGGGN